MVMGLLYDSLVMAVFFYEFGVSFVDATGLGQLRLEIPDLLLENLHVLLLNFSGLLCRQSVFQQFVFLSQLLRRGRIVEVRIVASGGTVGSAVLHQGAGRLHPSLIVDQLGYFRRVSVLHLLFSLKLALLLLDVHPTTALNQWLLVFEG